MKKSLRMKIMLLLFALIVGIGNACGQTWQKVTSAPSNWSGEYLIVYENSSTEGYCWTGVDAASCYASATISSGNISSKPSGAVSVTIASMTGGYSIKVNGGDNNGKYIQNNGSSNGIKFVDSGVATTFTYENSSVTITCGGKNFRYNSNSTDKRFRYYGSAQQVVQLYKKAHTLTYSADHGNIGGVVYNTTTAVNSGASIAEGGKVTLTANPDDGYAFSSWNDGVDNSTLSSTSTNPTTFTMGTSDVTITATFVQSGGTTTYSVTYNANGATSGSAPTDSNSPYESGSTVTVLDNTGSLAKTGNAFSGWNTQADGLGTDRAVGSTFNITANTILYAKWTPYTITAQSNNNTYGTVSLEGNVITGNPQSGYRYATPAYTVSSGSATVVQDNNEFTVTPTSNCTVTINFEAIPTHTAHFSVNGVIDNNNDCTVAEGAAITFPSNPAAINGKSFVGWYTSVYAHESTAPSFVNTSTTKMGNSDVTYYAVFADVEGSTADLTITNSDFTGALSGSYGSASVKKTIGETQYTINIYACKQNSMCQMRNSDSYIQIPTLPGNITNVSTTACNNAGDGSYTGTIRLKSAFAAGNTTTNDLFTKDLSDVTSFSISITEDVTTFYFVTSAGLRLNDFTVTYDARVYSNYNTTVIIPAVETPHFTVDAGTYNVNKSVEITCSTTGADIYYTTNGDDPTSSSTKYTSAISITQTTTLKAIAIKDEDSSEIASATYTLKCATPQFEVAGGNYTSDQTVVITSTDGATIYYTDDNSVPSDASTEYTAALTIDETTTLKAIAYKAGWTPSDVATAQYNLPTIYANIAAFKAAFSSTSNTLVKISGPLTTVYHDGKNLYVQDATGGMLVYDADAGTPSAVISRTYENGQTVSNVYGTYTKYNGLVEFIPNRDFPEPGAGTIVEPTDITSLSGANYATYESKLVRLTNATFKANNTYTSGSTGSNLSMKDGSNNTVVLRNGFQTLAGRITNGDKANVTGFATIYNTGTASYQLFPRDNNDIQYILETDEISSAQTIDFAAILKSGEIIEIEDGGVLTVRGKFTNEGDIMIDDGGQLVVNNTVEATIYKEITASNGTAGWYTISSPINYPLITDVSNLVTGASGFQYNLYRYNEEETNWEAYNLNSSSPSYHDDFTNLMNGQGYLYRNNDGSDLSFNGNVNVGSVAVTLTSSEEAGSLRGFNLIGNPFAHNIYKGKGAAIDNAGLGDGYYFLNNDGGWQTETYATPIPPMMGILVQVSGEDDIDLTIQDKTTAATAERYANDYLMFTVANNQYEDVTYAMFHEGYGLNKIDHRNSDIPMLYINQNNENYAIAMMKDNTQSFNLNFKAKTMGQYTLNYKTLGEFNYLHVIDRLTGNDIDMLLDGEYSFIGSPQDNEARFIVRLGYLPNYDDNGEDIFAYQNGSDIIISGEGELQIFDEMGRMISTQRVNGTKTLSVNTKGVYVFRLIGSEIKTQKIVVR